MELILDNFPVTKMVFTTVSIWCHCEMTSYHKYQCWLPMKYSKELLIKETSSTGTVMDTWDLLDEMDVIAQWPGDQKKAVESTKWAERKEALEVLLSLMEKNPRLSTSSITIYGELMDNLKKIIARDSNINVVAVAVKVLTALARGLRTKFAGFISMVFSVVLEKTKEKKALVRDLLGDCLDAMGDTCPIDKITGYICEAIVKPNPQMKQIIDKFIYRLLKQQHQPPIAFIKEVAPHLVKHASDADAEVRECAFSALGSMKRLLGPAIDTFLRPIASEEAKINKINEFCETATKEYAAEQAAKAAAGGFVPVEKGDTVDNDENDAPATSTSSSSAAIDPWTLLDPVNVWSKLSKEWSGLLESKKWQERKEALDELQKVLDENKRVQPGGENGEKIGILVKILEKDSNVNVAAGAAKSLCLLAEGLRGDFTPYLSKVLLASFEKLKEKKAALKDRLVELVDAAALTTPIDAFLEDLAVGLAKPNPVARCQVALFVSRLLSLHGLGTLSKEAARGVVAPLVKLTNDADSDVRDASFAALGALKRCVGEKPAETLMGDVEKLKMAKIDEACARLIDEKKGSGPSEAIVRLHGGGGVKKSERVGNEKRPQTAGVTASANGKVTARPAAPLRVPPVPRPSTAQPRPAAPVPRSQPVSRGPSRPGSSANSRASSPKRAGAVPNVVRSGQTAVVRPVTATRPSTAAGIRPNTVTSTPTVRNGLPASAPPPVVGVRPNVVTGASRPVTSAGIRPNVTRPGVTPNVTRPNVTGSSVVNGNAPTARVGMVSAREPQPAKPEAAVVTGIPRPSTGIRRPTPVNLAGSRMKAFGAAK